MISHLHLVVPGLFGPMPGLEALGLSPSAPALERLLARAEVTRAAGASLESALFALFGLPEPSGDLPSAALSRLGEGAEPDGGFWLHADPVFLKPTADRLLLFDAPMLDIRREDADGLVALFNQHFAQDGWRLEAPHPERWYLRLPTPPALKTTPLTDVVGRNIDPYLPSGPEADRWRSMLNETQMLFHSAAVNLRREAERLLPVNGIWLSGGGVLPVGSEAGFSAVMADDALSRGLARLSGVACHAASLDALAQHGGGACVAVHTPLQRAVLEADPQRWARVLEAFEQWAAALQRMLQKRRLERLSLYPCNGQRFQIDRRGLRRFWKPATPITGYHRQ